MRNISNKFIGIIIIITICALGALCYRSIITNIVYTEDVKIDYVSHCCEPGVIDSDGCYGDCDCNGCNCCDCCDEDDEDDDYDYDEDDDIRWDTD